MVASETNRRQTFAGSTGAATLILGGLVGVLTMPVAVMFTGKPAQAQSTCEFRKKLMDKLDSVYNEQPVGVGLASTGNVVELIVSPDGTWTIVVTKPNGLACIAAVGEDWQALEIAPSDESS